MSNEVVIQTAAAKTELGVTTPAATKTYPFDRVFGHAADQAMVYSEVVKPMLEEVLLGYNCTLFAYGQTGTGKTYTMQGDLTPSISGGPSAGAGMIPRVLSNLFAHLEANVPDYSVKVTYVELYNEELRDLLSPSLSAPLGSEQPMSKGTGSSAGQYSSQAQAAGNNRDPGPKIFEDARGGVFIQGLEESYVRNAHEAIEQLRKGSHRRQIAATKFNDHSSRSHSVFTVTVHTKMKETGASGSAGGVAGEDYIRTGKLNLVDLAGSENIGRSGAENMRAREAGNINMSLLALGRVINALVAKHAHIPYRESKLTRLLQDSLGGKTKTCIIATISPAQSNLEETFSTLDYALKAKSISNKPEVNQKMTRNSLLKEYIGLIECLKADLLAAREKNGIYMSKESWDDMSKEQSALRQAHIDAKQQCDDLEAQIRIIREELTESLGMLMKRDGELASTKKTLEKTAADLEATTEELATTTQMHVEEKVLREAHAETEEQLDSVARGLRNVASESVADVRGLWEKVERKERVRAQNAGAVRNHADVLAEGTDALAAGLAEFVGVQAKITGSMRSRMEDFRESELQSLNAFSSQVKTSIESLNEAIRAIGLNEKEGSASMDHLQQLVQTTSDTIQNSFETWAGGLKKQCTTLVEELQGVISDNCQAAETAMQTSADTYKMLVDETVTHLKREKELVGEARDLVQEAVSSEVKRLNEQNTLLRQMLESEERKTLELQEDLLSNMSSLVKRFVSSRTESLHAAGQKVQGVVRKGAKEMESFGKQHGRAVDDVLRHGDRVVQEVSDKAQRGRAAGEDALRAVRAVDSKARLSARDMRDGLEGRIDGQLEELRKQKETLSKGAATGFEQARQTKRARVALTESMSAELQQGYRDLQSGLSSTTNNASQTILKLLDEETSLRQTTQSYKANTQKQLGSLRQATRALVESGTRDDTPTGTTPRKRTWDYDDEWERTKSREAVLREWAVRQQLQEQAKRDEVQRQRLSNASSRPTESPDVVETASAASEEATPVRVEEPLKRPESEVEADDEVDAVIVAAEINARPPPPPYSTISKVPGPAPSASTTRTSSRQSTMGTSQLPSRPPSKIGSMPRTVSGKAAQPLVERANVGTRTKRVR